jgi:putative hydrolase of the HAD superfamily
MTSLIPPPTRAIVFDAVGTLIHTAPPAPAVYFETGHRFGSRRTEAEIAARFPVAFRRQDEIDYAAGLRTDEARELARWQAIVAEVLDDVTDTEACFRLLYEHFARPTAWRVEPDAVSTIARLTARGYRLAIASNFDHRLRQVLAGGPFAGLPLVISSEIGWRKPAEAFFQAICGQLAVQPSELLYVGDDLPNDVDGARSAGCDAILFDPRNTAPRVAQRVQSLGAIADEQ